MLSRLFWPKTNNRGSNSSATLSHFLPPTFTNDNWRAACCLVGKTRFPELASSSKQFVGENAQAINRGCLHPQNNWAESDRAATVAASEVKFGWCKIALRTDAHENADRARVMFTRILRKHLL